MKCVKLRSRRFYNGSAYGPKFVFPISQCSSYCLDIGRHFCSKQDRFWNRIRPLSYIVAIWIDQIDRRTKFLYEELSYSQDILINSANTSFSLLRYLQSRIKPHLIEKLQVIPCYKPHVYNGIPSSACLGNSFPFDLAFALVFPGSSWRRWGAWKTKGLHCDVALVPPTSGRKHLMERVWLDLPAKPF